MVDGRYEDESDHVIKLQTNLIAAMFHIKHCKPKIALKHI